MKWFKHFADNHRGISIRALMNELGHSGLCYYILMEMCAEKLEQDGVKKPAEADCSWQFDQRLVRQNCRLSCGNVRRLLDVCQTNGLLSWEIVGSEFRISMPILLTLLDRDSIRARKVRANAATKPRPDLELDKEEDKELRANKKRAPAAPGFDFEDLYRTYPRKRGKDEGMIRLKSRIKTKEQFDSFARAVREYSRECRMERTDQTKILYWSSFIGTDEKQPWRDFLGDQRPAPAAAPALPEPTPEDIGPPLSPEDLKANLDRLNGLMGGLVEKTSLKKIG